MKRIAFLLLLATGLSVFAAEDGGSYKPRGLYDEVCTRCHMQEGYVWERSFKAWQATVYTMQGYAFGDDEFSDEEADIIVDFLTEQGGRIEMELLGMLPEEEEASTNNAVAEVVSGVETERMAVVEVGTNAVAVSKEVRKIKPPGRHRVAFDFSAKVSGYFGFAFLLCSVGTGLGRKKLKKNFRAIHRTAAIALLTTAMLHSVYFLLTLGLPSLLWFQMGIGATAILLATELCGGMRRVLKKTFLKVHITGALIGLVATILHWVWIYI
ncbi:MAG: hypothetical protein K9M45_02400 [Kiritimatiellales bacterium]|nr:hypothetical protein [Kiritimatiellales bacterium]